MNGNTPYAGAPGTLQAGQQIQQRDFTPTIEQVIDVRHDIKRVADGIRKHLPEGFQVSTLVDSHPQQGPVAQVFIIFPFGGQMGATLPLTEEMFEDTAETDNSPYRVFDPENVKTFQSNIAATAVQQLMQVDSGTGPAK